MCRHHGGTTWHGRAEDDVLQEQSDGAPSGGVGEHAVGSSGGRGGAERGERTGDMSDMRPNSKSLFGFIFSHSKSLFVTAKVGSPPLVESRPVTGPHPLYQPLGDP